MKRRLASGWGESCRARGRWTWLATGVLAAAAGTALLMWSGGAGKAGAQAADPADLAVAKSDSPDPVVEGQVLTYTLAVDNAGPDPATGVAVTDRLPSRVDPISAQPSTGNCAVQGRNVTCQLGTMENGASATVTIEVRTKNDGLITNTASVESEVEDPETANNEDSETTTITEVPKPKKPRCRKQRATIVGTNDGETLTGTNGKDVIRAGGGNDRIEAGGGHDVICAGGGRDFVRTGGGNDFAKGQRGRDRLKGQRGGDTLKGNRGRDRLKGGRGNDVLAGGKGRDRCKGGRGRDVERSC